MQPQRHHPHRWLTRVAHLLLLVWVGWLATGCAGLPLTLEEGAVSSDASGVYEYHTLHDPDGIGKFYMGREIAQVMGHRGAAWLERPSRVREEHPDAFIQSLPLQPTDAIADIGAGTGYMSFRLSPQVPQGRVLAVDVQPEMIEILTALKADYGADNVEPILGSETDPHLPAHTLDWAIMVDAYHEFAHPREMMTQVVDALKPGGHVVLVEYRGENPLIPIKGLHKMTQSQVRREMKAVGLVWQKTDPRLPQQHVMIFQKPEGFLQPDSPAPFPDREIQNRQYSS